MAVKLSRSYDKANRIDDEKLSTQKKNYFCVSFTKRVELFHSVFDVIGSVKLIADMRIPLHNAFRIRFTMNGESKSRHTAESEVNRIEIERKEIVDDKESSE